ncbi:MAG TPA: M48 family metalloprotease [Candidatus Eremiobacteraceae bacterium]|nr:M48 family metalloprotease [Candidatus Eremiobacteraceae bacterium]
MRFIAIFLAATLLAGVVMPAAPAAAMSTAQEVSLGQGINQQIDDENVIVTDPFLTSWVDSIGAKLATNKYRQDINYHFEVLNTDEVNAFALPGGFMHADMGLLNFVGSDDELAAVLGHEMGHVERRHVVTLQQKNNILGILIGIISILSPIAAALGGYGGDLVAYKFSRQDELQADQYGLLLMTRAGYDPQSNIDMMAHLDKLSANDPTSHADKAMLSHPPPKDRIAHLEGYPELNNPPAEQTIADAIHDEQEGRYTYSRARLQTALKKSPGNKIALAHLSQVEVALRESGVPGTLHERSVAYTQTLDAFSMGDIATRLAKAQAIATDGARIAADRARSSHTDLQTLFNQLNEQTNSIPNLGKPKKKGNNLSLAIDGLKHLTRDINGVLGNSSDVLSSGPGLARDNLGPFKDMADAISSGPPSEKTRALLPYYPSLSASLSDGADQFVTGVDDARAAISMASDGVRLLANFFAALNSLDTTGGDISAKDMPKVQSALDAATSAWDAAYAMSQRAADLTYGAQTRTLSASITLLDLYSSSERYQAYRRAMQFRFPGVQLPDYQTVLRSGITPGELGCDAWLGFETKDPVTKFMRAEHDGGLSCADIALQKNLMTESMEIAEGLLYEDYVEVPEKV